MFCGLCRRLFWRGPKPAGRPEGRSRTRAVRRAAVETRSSVRAILRDNGLERLETNVGICEGHAEEERLVIDVKLDRLLDGVRLAAEHHGSDDSDLPHDVRGQHECDGLGSFDLGWIGNKNLNLVAGRGIV
jgi:hypothetical protein